MTPAQAAKYAEMRYNPNVLKDNYKPFAGLDWFRNPDVSVEVMGIDPRSQSIVLTYEKWENPFDNVDYQDITNKYTGDCPPFLSLDCGGCLSTVPDIERVPVKYDSQYKIGASWCPELKSMTISDLETQFNKRMNDFKTVSAVIAWNKLICEAIANPAKTIGREGESFSEHYIEAGDARVEGVDTLTDVITYFDAYFNGEYRIFADRAFEKDIVASGMSTIHTYDKTGIPSAAPQDDELIQGGWKPMPAVPEGLWGHQIYIAPDFKGLYTGAAANPAGVNKHPFLSPDGTRYYVLFATQRSFFTGVMPVGEGHYYPVCNDGYESISKRWLSFNKILFPEEVFVVSFKRNITQYKPAAGGGAGEGGAGA